VGRDRDHGVAVADAAEAQALKDRKPGADAALEDPDRRQQRGRGGEDRGAAGTPAAALGGRDREGGRRQRQ